MFAIVVAAFSLLAPQLPPSAGGIAKSPTARYVDCSDELDRVNVSVVLGKLGKLKEGKRERLPDGQLGGAGQVASVSGTQYFKVPVTAPVEVRTTLAGPKLTRAVLQFEQQIARLPDGKERRQLRTADAAELGEATPTLFVLEIDPKTKEAKLLHAVPFDAKDDKGEDAFVAAMRDMVAVNVYVHQLKVALAELDAAKGEEPITKAKAALKELLDRRPELQRPEDDAMLTMHAAPFEQRARKRVDG
jgi:hypothetical protein